VEVSKVVRDLSPVSGLLTVTVNVTVLSAGVSTGTLTLHAAAGALAGQLLPAAAVVIVLASRWLPVSGLLTVTVPVTVTVPPTGCPRSTPPPRR
jgi:hypothetical protein